MTFNNLSALSELGLNEYEIKAYIAILSEGIVVARKVSEISTIPYAKVYQVLDTLIAKGLIIGDESRPKRFYAVDPSEGLQKRLTILEEQWKLEQEHRKELVKQLTPMLTQLYEQSGQIFKREETVYTITGSINIYGRINKLLPRVKKNIILIGDAKSSFFRKVYKSVKSLTGIELIILTNDQSIKGDVTKIMPISDKTIILILDKLAMFQITRVDDDYTAVLNQISSIVDMEYNMYSKLISGD